MMALFAGLLLALQPAWAAGPPSPSPFSNPLALVLLTLMLLLLLVIGILANILIGAADLKLKKKKQEKSGTSLAGLLLLPLLLASTGAFAQGAEATKAAKVIGGLPASTFYVLIGIIFLEMLIIIGLLLNIRFLLKTEKERLAPEAAITPEAIKEAKRNQLSWWDRFNMFKPLSKEAELDLGHEYDGIRELNNRLPPWWLYGFYLTIIFAAIYLWRFHVSHTGPSSKEEYERSVARAEVRIQEYLKLKGENVNETNVTFLNNAADLAAGKEIFMRPGFCNACHGTDGSGIVNGAPGVGPNLTDVYWLNGGGGIKDIFKVVKYGGRPNKGMQSWESQLSAKQIAQVSSYVKSLVGTKPAKGKEPEPEAKPYQEEAAPAAPAAPKADSTAGKANPVTMNK